MELYNIKNVSLYTENKLKISFCATLMENQENLNHNIDNIINIAEEIGIDYEIIISANFKIDLNKNNVKFIYDNFKSYGAGKQIAYLKSTGDYIVVFDPNISYNISISDIIYNFIKKGEKKAFLYTVLIINRDLLKRSGGWRNLREYEDIDLFVRLSRMSGFVAYPADIYGILNYRQNKKTFINNIINERDAIISCNYGLNDAFILKHASYFSIILAYLLSKTSKNRPYRYGKNNYIIVVESIIESLILKDYEIYNIPEKIPKLKFTEKEIKYLEKKSYLWNKVNKSINELIEK